MKSIATKIISWIPVLIIVPILGLILALDVYFNDKSSANSTADDAIQTKPEVDSTIIEPIENKTPIAVNNSQDANQFPRSYNSKPDFELDFDQIQTNTSVNTLLNIQDGISEQWDPVWNDEAQMYTPNNISINDGKLVIKAKVEEDGTITSARLDTKGIFEATYGKFEIVAKLPGGTGTFPAIWLLPVDGSYFRDNVANAEEKASELSWQGGGEIDIAEKLGALPGEIYHDAHTYNSLIANAGLNSGSTKLTNETSTYHTYAIEWSPDSIVFKVDGVKTHEVHKQSNDFRSWPFDKPFYLIINLAMGGNWNKYFIGDQYPNGIDRDSQDEWELSIKSIRHYSIVSQN